MHAFPLSGYRQAMRWISLPFVGLIGVVMNTSVAIEPHCCEVLELRQYTLKPGQRDALITLFDRYFVESQEAMGMTVVGQFRDRQRSDRFVWVRGFSDMESRRTALASFYESPMWAAHRVE